MSKTQQQPRFAYPPYVDLEVGYRVSWYYYNTLEEAEKAAAVAEEHGDWCAARGFDFGFCCPGYIEKVREGKHKGLYSVCIP